METEEKERYGELVETALQAGATVAKSIPAAMVVVDERVRLKCEVPRCASYNQYLTCPPHVMSVARFSSLLSLYEWCLLVQVEADVDSSSKGEGGIGRGVLDEYRKLHRPYKLKLLTVIEKVEAAAFKMGMRFAAGLTGGSCVLCEECVENKAADACRFPFRSRPAMEGVGIDVVATTQKAGVPVHLSSSKNVLWTGLVLLE